MSQRVVIIGAVAAGPKAGCRIKRLDPSAKVTMIDRDDIISYGGCGIPYYVSGDVAGLEGLRSTSAHILRDEAFFKGAKGVDVLAGWEALEIDREAKEVHLQEVNGSGRQTLGYDKLVLATGSEPNIPPIPGIDLPGVWPVANLHQARAIKNAVAKGQVGAAAVLGAGPTGLEMAEALADLWDVDVTVYEMANQTLPGLLDTEMARFVQVHLEKQGVKVEIGARVEKILGDAEQGAVGLKVDGQEIETDLVIAATGVRPQTELAAKAGLELGLLGALQVNEYLQTSDPDIFAGGDCVANRSLITGGEAYLASGSIANRHGRIIGTNVVKGPSAKFPGVVGAWIMKLFDNSVAKVGLTHQAAEEAGFDPVSALVVQADRAHFYPGQELMYLKLTIDRKTRRVLGLQGVAGASDALAARIDAMAAILPFKPTVEDISNLEVAYAPPFASAMDILNATANTAENTADGKGVYIQPEAFARLLHAPEEGTVFLDVRDIRNAEPYLEALADKGWCHISQETLAERLSEVPQGKKIITMCNVGSRSYEAQITLREAGFKNLLNLSGGLAAVHRLGEPIIPEEKEG